MNKQKRLWILFFLALFLHYPSYCSGEISSKVVSGDREEIKSEQETKKLEEMKKRWNELIEMVSEKNPFFDFETEESKRIREESKSEKALLAILKNTLNVETLISLTFERNQALKAAKKEWESKLEAYSQVAQLEDILNQFSSFVRDIDTKSGSMLHQISVKKRFPFPGAMTLKGNIVEKEVQIAKEKYDITLRDLISDIKQTFYEWVFVLEEISITEENIALLKELESVAAIHFRTGKGGFNDVLKAQVKIIKMEEDLKTLQEQEKVIKAKITRHLNLPLSTPLGKPAGIKNAFISLSVEELYKTALKNEQKLKLLQAEVEKTNLAIELAEKKYYPDLSLGFAYFENRQKDRVGTGKTKEAFEEKPAAKTDFWFGENDAYIREVRLKYQSLLNSLESHKDMIQYSISKHYFMFDKARREILLYEDSLLDLARKELDVAVAEYQTGKADFLSLLDAQTTLLKFQLDHQRAIKDYGQALAMMEQSVGVGLVK